MEVLLAKSAGFCFGVKRAVETVYEQIAAGGKIYTFGPIIHNEQVVGELEQKGVSIVESDAICDQGLTCVDATCPFVKRIHRIVERESAAGKQILIIGNAGHPEVEGIKSWCSSRVAVAETREEVSNLELDLDKPVCIVSQTTFNYNKFQELVEIFSKRGYDISVVNTICNATEVRQAEAREIAARADAMIVIGGRHSSNTRKLHEICSQECARTYFIQTLDDLHLELPKSVGLVGITAGASTPKKIIEEVQNYVRINF